MSKNAKNSKRIGNGKGLDDKNETLLNALERKLVFLVVNKPSLSVSELSRELEMDRRVVEKLLNKETIKLSIAEFQKDCDQILLDSLTRAAQVVRAMLNSTDEKVKSKVAIDLLKGLGKLRNYNDTRYVD